MKAIIVIIFAFGLLSCSAQSSVRKTDSEKVDSVFAYYFSLVELEIRRPPVDESNIHLYREIILDSDTVYMLKDLPQAIVFLSDLSEIRVAYSEKASEMMLTREIADSWIKWYKENRHRVTWSQKMKRPISNKKS